MLKTKIKKRVKPGWSSHETEFLLKAREASKEWILAGKPRHGSDYKVYCCCFF